MTNETKEVSKIKIRKYPKLQFLRNKKFLKDRTILRSLLKDGETYTIGEVESKLKAYKSKVVK